MNIWRRFGRGIRRTVERLTDRFTEPSPPPAPPPREQPDFEPPSREEDRESRLPPGWVLVGLYHEGEKTQKISATDDTEVTDSEIQHADAIIVHYTDGGEDGYKWIHGASGWDSVSDQITRVVIIVSPTGTRA